MLRLRFFHFALLVCGLILVFMLATQDTSSAQKPSLHSERSARSAHTAEEERDVAESLFRYLLPQARNDWKSVQVVFLRWDGKDPDVLLLRRFENSALPVKAASASKTGKRLQVMDKATGQEGVVLALGRLHWISASKVEVTGGYYHNGKGAMATSFRLIHQGSQWRVQRFGSYRRA